MTALTQERIASAVVKALRRGPVALTDLRVTPDVARTVVCEDVAVIVAYDVVVDEWQVGVFLLTPEASAQGDGAGE